MSRIILSIPTLLGLLLAGASVIVPIAWDNYKSETAIELQHLTTVTLVEEKHDISKLEVFYDGRKIKNLSKSLFSIVNTGNTPIIEEDVKSPLKIVFGKNSKLLDFKVEKLHPANLIFTTRIDKKENSLLTSFPLLNPSDFVQFSVITSSLTPKYRALALIKGVKKFPIVNRSSELEQKRKEIPWTIYPVGGFTILFLTVLIQLAGNDIKLRKVRTEFLKGHLEIPTYNTKKDI